MKKKPILIIASILVAVVCVFAFVRSKYLVKPDKKDVIVFLDRFNADLKKGNTDTLLDYFDGRQNVKQIKKLLGLISNKTSLNGKDKPLFDVNLLSDDSEIKIINAELTDAQVPVQFKENGANLKQTTLLIKLRKVSAGQFKIVQIDARKFAGDFMVYENNIRTRNRRPEDIYAPITLKAFATAEQLKTRYDSVIWFAHIDNQTYFYVVKGKWGNESDRPGAKDSATTPYKMGLLNPQLKEIISPQYDLIHTIGATFPGMIEVEKEHKRGFYDINGKIIVPVSYDQIFPINDDTNAAVLKNGADYFYLKKDMSISEKVELKLNDFFSKIKYLNSSFDLYPKALSLPVLTEYNSHEQHGAIYIGPSYLSDLNIIHGAQIDFQNPLRKVEYFDVHKNYEIRFSDKDRIDTGDWLTASFYSIRDYFLGGRAEFYDTKNVVMLDKKNDRILTQQFGTDYGKDEGDSYSGSCDINNVKILADSLIEIKTGATLSIELYDSTKSIVGGPYYHYLTIKDNQFVELPNRRSFGFTKYVKMDDSYLYGCFEMWRPNSKTKTFDHLTPEILRYMKNEIYADYRYAFKDKRWQDIFLYLTSEFDAKTSDLKPNNANVDDSLTVIDKYNINWINQKLKAQKPNTLAAK
ncbi:WG repeat-containing protein [Mucilaginibacter paludis]|uniref:Uncharacterized protein n=1 Tax=Mucilaginibacter paludis DSM 18603 TaxID=714943 RepID=H1XZY9_9SPHI|nr:WG repeat-containing protein [Mucilaginibacter paludis]EHQ27831.1 hypothetical protein Mucpa_3733 [Mucilaginibacter paludis DSM 18603]